MGANRAFDVLTMLDLPRGELGASYGSFLSEGISDYISGQRGGKPVNSERATLVGEIADAVGLDRLRTALYDGNVDDLQSALEGRMGKQRAAALKDALLSNDANKIRAALKEPPPRPAPKPSTTLEANGREPAKVDPAASAAKGADHGPPTVVEPLKPGVVEAQQKLAAALVDNPHAGAGAFAEPAGNLIKEASNFKGLREMVESLQRRRQGARQGDPTEGPARDE